MIQSMASNIYLPQMFLSLPLHIDIHSQLSHSNIHLFGGKFLCSKYHHSSSHCSLAVQVFGEGGQWMTVQTKCKSDNQTLHIW